MKIGSNSFNNNHQHTRMKLITAIALGVLVSGSSFAQTATTKKPAADAKMKADKCIISGTIKDTRKQPVKGVEAFVYKADSSIVASGITDMTGHFETNGVMPGDYFVKLVYPNNKNVMLVTGITIKKPGNTEVNFKGEAPAADTAVTYVQLMPPPTKIILTTKKK